MNATAETIKEVKYDRQTGDYSYSLNGEIVGWAATRFQADQALNELVYDLLSRPNVDAADLTPEEAEAVLVAQIETSFPSPTPAPKFAPATRASIAAAVAQARAAAQDQARWVRAINRGYDELLIGLWIWDGDRLVIASRSRPGKRHNATATHCSCEAFAAGKPCFHRASVRLLQIANAAA